MYKVLIIYLGKTLKLKMSFIIGIFPECMGISSHREDVIVELMVHPIIIIKMMINVVITTFIFLLYKYTYLQY